MRTVCLAGFVLIVSTCAVATARAEEAVRVRIEWGGGASRVWSGLLELDEGRFGRIEALGVDAEQPGTMWADGSVVWIQRRARRVYDGFDVEVRASPGASLRLTLQSRDEPPVRTSVDVPLAELFDGECTRAIGTAGGRVVLRRTPGDALRLETERAHLVFDPGETFAADVALNLCTPDPLDVRGALTWTLSPAHESTVLARGRSKVTPRTNATQPERVPFRVALPDAEGAYDLRFAFESRSLRHESRVQVVVASGVPRNDDVGPGDAVDRPAKSADSLVDAFETNGSCGRRIERRERLAFLRRPLADLARILPFGTGDAPDDTNEPTDDEPAWTAYTLRVARLDRLHRLVVTLDAEPPRQVGLSVLQPDAAGHLVPLGLDAGVRIPAEAGETIGETDADGRRVVRYAIPFWPSVERPVLLVHELDAGTPVGVRRVEVFEVHDAPPIASERIDRTSGRRWIGPYLHRPLLPEACGAPQALDGTTSRSLDDWRTFDLATARFAERLRRSGENAAMLVVLGEGSTLYPSDRLRPSLRYDTGRHFSDGGDPLRKDVVELLLRRFDREGLVLVPTLQFTSALPALEQSLARGNDSGVELVHADGRTWRETHGGARSGGPFYDPLDERVQGAVLEVVEEFAARYADHPSLGAIAIDLGADGCLRFPEIEWGCSEAAIARFVRETRTSLPPVPSGSRDARRARAAVLTGEFRSRWTAWRSEQLAAFHERLARAVTSAHPELRCVFLVEGRPVVDRDTVELLDTARLARLERTSVVERVDPAGEVSEPLAGRRGLVEFAAPVGTRIAGFDELSPWQPALVWVAANVTTIGPAGRQPFAQAAAYDEVMLFRGGWLPTSGDDAATNDVRSRLAELPDVRMVSVPRVPQPLVVRTGRSGGRTWIVVANDFPHPVTASLTLAGEAIRGESREHLVLTAHDLRVLSFPGSAHVEEVTARLAPGVEEELRRRLQELDEVITRLRERRTERRGELPNPGFELAGATEYALPGWSVPVRDAALWTVDEEHPRTGRASLMLAPRPTGVAAIGSDLPLDRERHVVVSAWMRADADEAEARLVFETVVDGRTRQRFAPVRVGTKWARFGFRIDDVPTNVTAARVRFEVRGPVRVWIDDVEVRLAHVTPAELRKLETTYAAADLALANERYADSRRLLGGPWRRLVPRPESPPEKDAAEEEPSKPASPEDRGPERVGRSWWNWRLFR